MRIGTEMMKCLVIMGMLGNIYIVQDYEQGLVDGRQTRKLALCDVHVHNLEAWMEDGRMSQDTQAIREARCYYRQLNLERAVLLHPSRMYINYRL